MCTPLSVHKSKTVCQREIFIVVQRERFELSKCNGGSSGLPGCQCRQGKSSVGEDIYRADLKAVPDDGHLNSTKPTSTQIPLPKRIVMTFLICLQSGICDGSLIYQLFKFRSEHIIGIQPIVASVFNRIKISSLNAALERHKKFFILRRNAGII